jgi:hypothetical protein
MTENSVDAQGSAETVTIRARFDNEIYPVHGSNLVDGFAIERVHDERKALGLTGLLPPEISTLGRNRSSTQKKTRSNFFWYPSRKSCWKASRVRRAPGFFCRCIHR